MQVNNRAALDPILSMTLLCGCGQVLGSIWLGMTGIRAQARECLPRSAIYSIPVANWYQRAAIDSQGQRVFTVEQGRCLRLISGFHALG